MLSNLYVYLMISSLMLSIWPLLPVSVLYLDNHTTSHSTLQSSAPATERYCWGWWPVSARLTICPWGCWPGELRRGPTSQSPALRRSLRARFPSRNAVTSRPGTRGPGPSNWRNVSLQTELVRCGRTVTNRLINSVIQTYSFPNRSKFLVKCLMINSWQPAAGQQRQAWRWPAFYPTGMGSTSSM